MSGDFLHHLDFRERVQRQNANEKWSETVEIALSRASTFTTKMSNEESRTEFFNLEPDI